MRPLARHRGSLVGALVGLSASVGAAPARAEEAQPERPAREAGVFDVRPGYAQVQAHLFVGDALRFNNPYRLATPLGSDAESVSRTAAYVDFGVTGLLGDPLGLQHGLTLRTSFAVEGIRQQVITPGYVLWRRWRALAAYGRAGTPIVLTPQPTWGLEVAAGGVLFVRGGIGIAGELVGAVAYGAGTRDKAVTTYPMLGAQLGLLFALEVLP